MKKYCCLDCGFEFDEPEIVLIEPHLFDEEGEPYKEAWCPCCDSDRFEEQNTLDGCIIESECLGVPWVKPEYKRRPHD